VNEPRISNKKKIKFFNEIQDLCEEWDKGSSASLQNLKNGAGTDWTFIWMETGHWTEIPEQLLVAIGIVFAAVFLTTFNIITSVLALLPPVFGMGSVFAQLETQGYEIGNGEAIPLVVMPCYFTLFSAGLLVSFDFSHRI